MNPTAALVACSKTKLAEPAEARELYSSPLFRLSRRYAELVADQWFILSALLGLVEPGKLIAPYERTLGELNARARRIWGFKVAIELRGTLPPGTRLILLAGRLYADPLKEALESHAPGRFEIVEPLAGLQIGERLAWLKNRTIYLGSGDVSERVANERLGLSPPAFAGRSVENGG